MYANLLATSLDRKTANEAHPGFVEILKSMSPDEARILKVFVSGQSKPIIDIQLHLPKGGYHTLNRNVSIIGAEAGCAHRDLVTNYLDNLCRLGLLEIEPMARIKEDKAYDPIIKSPELTKMKEDISKQDGLRIEFKKKKIDITGLGRQFSSACIIDKRTKEPKAQSGSEGD